MVLALGRHWSNGLVSLVAALVASSGCNTRHESPATAASARSVAVPTTAAPTSPPPQNADPGATAARPEPSPVLLAKAKELTHKFILLDGHVDLPWRLDESRDKDGNVSEDVSHRTAKGDFDWERALPAYEKAHPGETFSRLEETDLTLDDQGRASATVSGPKALRFFQK